MNVQRGGRLDFTECCSRVTDVNWQQPKGGPGRGSSARGSTISPARPRIPPPRS